jgi:hypothetical protein
MNENIPPEERLLKLIRGERKPRTAALPKQNTESDPSSDSAKVVPPAFKKNPGFVLPRVNLDQAAVRKILIAAVSLSLFYLAAVFVFPLVVSQKISLPDLPVKAESRELAAEEALNPYEFYSGAVNQRRIFNNVSGSAQGSGPAQAVANADLVKQINLVGIISGDEPQAIVEDKNAQKTYYVAKGQSIGEIIIEDIQEGKVIVSYKGQRFVLYL